MEKVVVRFASLMVLVFLITACSRNTQVLAHTKNNLLCQYKNLGTHRCYKAQGATTALARDRAKKQCLQGALPWKCHFQKCYSGRLA